MRRGLFVVCLCSITFPALANDVWSSLWRNADQQGEALLQKGDAAAAAKRYTEPHRQGYAKLQAGDYAGAAKALAGLPDSDANYNRGNALAHTGDLQGALDAYDTALKLDPKNQDAQHNRELVAKAMQQKPPQQQGTNSKSSKGGKSSSQQGKDNNPNDSNQGKQGNKGSQGNDGKSTPQSPSAKDKASPAGKQSSGDGQDNANTNNTPSEKGADKHESKSTQGQPPSATQNNIQNEQTRQQPPAKDDAEQARRDAAASLDKATTGQASTSDKDLHDTQPKTEQQIAQEQWLRSIPDDPSGLLRRKFLIEHMMRQQKAQQ